MGRYKAIFHISETDKWNTLVSNVNNLIRDLGQENVIIKVVANGDAVLKYIPDGDNEALLDELENASNLGVVFAACRNSLQGRSIDETELPKFVEIVPAGVGELVKRQHEGYAYIRP